MKTKKRLKLRKEVKILIIIALEIVMYSLASNNVLGTNATLALWLGMIVAPIMGVK